MRRVLTTEAKQLAREPWELPKAGACPPLLKPRLLGVTEAHPASPYVFLGPAVLALLLCSPLTLSGFGAFGAGVVLWTLVEYLLHRFAFHFPRRGPVSSTVALLVHGHHHHYPADPRRIVATPAQSLSLFVLLGAALWFLFGVVAAHAFVAPTLAGTVLGYLGYEWAHWSAHHRRPRTAWGKVLKRHHLEHHHRSRDGQWGISTTVWDHIFQTTRRSSGPIGRSVR